MPVASAPVPEAPAQPAPIQEAPAPKQNIISRPAPAPTPAPVTDVSRVKKVVEEEDDMEAIPSFIRKKMM
jgi:hypothetical protein